jgi:hypothetical protein
MGGKDEQTSFTQGGDLVQRVEIFGREQITAQYILNIAEVGDTLRDITRKLPGWVKYKNDVRGVLRKLIALDIIYTIQTPKGAEIDEISENAKYQAERFIRATKQSLKDLNFLGNGYYHDLPL